MKQKAQELTPKDETTGFSSWGILELMGHRRLAGKVSEAQIGGGAFVRVDVPGPKGGDIATQFYNPSAVYCFTPTTEELARKVSASCQPAPVTEWDLPTSKALRGRGDFEEQ